MKCIGVWCAQRYEFSDEERKSNSSSEARDIYQLALLARQGEFKRGRVVSSIVSVRFAKGSLLVQWLAYSWQGWWGARYGGGHSAVV